MDAPRTPREVAEWASKVHSDLVGLLAKQEVSQHRVLTLSASFSKLQALSIRQEEMMREALRCVEQGLYRPAHVSSWAAFVDYCQEWSVSGQNLQAFQAARPKWNVQVAADLREYTDFALFDALVAAGLINKTFGKAMQGQLNKRNECAHPDEYSPGLNDTLGYVDELMKRIAMLQKKAT